MIFDLKKEHFMKRYLILLVLILAAGPACDLFEPDRNKEPVVQLNLHFVQSDQKMIGSETTRQQNDSLPAVYSLDKPASTLPMFNKLEVIFYDLQPDLDWLLEGHNYSGIESFHETFRADPSNFEDYWVTRDKGEFKHLTDGKFGVEYRTTLMLKNGTFKGEFNLSPGVKSCRIGCFRRDSLIAVGMSRGTRETCFFKLADNETKEIDINVTPIIATRNTPPVASFIVIPASGSVDSLFTFDASGCFDLQDRREELKVRWDWTNDEYWDTEFSTEKIMQHRFTSAGEFAVRLEVQDTGGLTGTAVKTVSVGFTPPVITGPEDEHVFNTSRPSLSWQTVDGAARYFVQIDNNADFSSPVIQDSVTENRYQFTEDLPDANYVWRVRAGDEQGNKSEWSDTHSFTIQTTGPAAPSLVEPANDSRIAKTNPALSWSLVSDANVYQVQLADNRDFTSPIVNDSLVYSTAIVVNVDLADKIYYWRVRGKNSYGSWGGWSMVWVFAVDTRGPARPALVQPEDQTVTDANTPEFVWNDTPDASAFELQVADNNRFNSPVIQDSTLTGTSYFAGENLPDGEWYWRLRAKDDLGNWGEWSEIWMFTVDTRGPNAPDLSEPEPEATLTGGSQNFSWQPVMDAQEYELVIADNQSFLSPVFRDTTLTDTAYPLTIGFDDGVYYWRVRAKDSAGNWGLWSPAWPFLVDTQGPVAPNLIDPKQGSTLTDTTVYFSWEMVTDAWMYELVVADNADFISPVFRDSSLTDTAYMLPLDVESGTYYWRVRGQDIAGNWGDWSEVWSFTMDVYTFMQMEWVQIQGGTFEMGSTSNDANFDEQPVHSVTVSDFEISKYEVTNAQFCQFLNETDVAYDGTFDGILYIDIRNENCQIDTSGGMFVVEDGMENYPVILVTWYGANAFCEWTGGRLPTEAEWEYAARGGQQSGEYIYAGSNNVDEVAWYVGNSGNQTHTVGQKQPNELELYDMSGNVNEWCSDFYDEYYYYNSPQNDPQGPEAGYDYVLRGGGYGAQARAVRCADRNYNVPDHRTEKIGFRCARSY